MDGFSNTTLFNRQTLLYRMHADYYDALATNDTELVNRKLTQATSAHRAAMLNGTFEFGDDETFIPRDLLAKVSRPLLVAATLGSVDVVQLLLNEGSDLFQETTCGGNIVHCIVSGCASGMTSEEDAVSLYRKLSRVLNQAHLKKLLVQEDKYGLRPLELAAHLGCLLLYEIIQLTPGVYVTKTVKKGAFKEEWIDVTEYETYESGHRRYKSPMLIFAYLDKRRTSESNHRNIHKSDLVTLWSRKKMSSVKSVILFWILTRAFYGAIFFNYITRGQIGNPLNSTKYSNISKEYAAVDNCENKYLYLETSAFVSNIMVAYLIFHSSLIVLTSIIAWIKSYQNNLGHYEMSFNERKELLVHYKFYSYSHFFTGFVYVIAGILSILDLNGSQTLVNWLITLVCTSSLWSVLYFVQTFPSIGHFAIAIQRMVWVLWQFIIVFIITFTPFAHAFYRLLQQPDGCPNPDFSSSPPLHFYNTFLLMLNMVDLKQYRNDIKEGDYGVLLFLHVAFVFMLPILLINFLIALLSTSVAEIMEHKDVIMEVQRLCVIAQTEGYMDQLGFCLRPLWKLLQRNHFHIREGRYYLIRISLITCQQQHEFRFDG